MRASAKAGISGTARLGLLLCLLAAMLTVPSLASADVNICPPGQGAGQCSAGNISQGAIGGPQGLAVDSETERLYVADPENNRIDVFEANGTFLFAFGWGVDTGAAKAETCTTASTCQAGIAGFGAGQLRKPRNIAVDNIAGSPSRHDIYVNSSESFRVQKFKADGSFEVAFGWGVDTGAAKLETCTTVSGCQAGIEGEGECQAGNLSNFSGAVAVGPGGNVFFGDAYGKAGAGAPGEANLTDRIEKFSAAGACLGETVLAKGDVGVLGGQLAIDSSEDAWVGIDSGGGARRYDLSAPENLLCTPGPDSNIRAITIDSTGHVFVASFESRAKGGEGYRVITEYDSACKPLRRFGYGQLQENAMGLAALHSAEGDLYVSEAGDGGSIPGILHYLKIPAPGPVVTRASAQGSLVGNAKARVEVEVNPEGKATEVHVDYVDDAHFKEAGFASPATKSTEPVPLSVAEGHEFGVNLIEPVIGCPVASKALIEEGKCLNPETTYHYRVVATSADNPTGKGEGTLEGEPFTTKKPLDIENTFATEVGTDSATLNAVVNPLGIPGTGYFEYVDDAAFQESGFAEAARVPDTGAEPPQAPIGFGSAEAATRRSVTLYPLQAGTTYHYRLAVTDSLIEGSLFNQAKTFRAFPTQEAVQACPENEAFRNGAAALLPDCRAYEMASPVDKANGDIVNLLEAQTNLPAVVNQAATSGEKLTYGSYRAFGDAQAAPYTSQYIAARDPEAGWQSHAISPPSDGLIHDGAIFDNEYRAFSPDLCEAWLDPFNEPPLAEGAVPGYENLYRRSDPLCGNEGYEAISTAKPANKNANEYRLEVQGFSANGEVTAFVANDSLEGTAAPTIGTTAVQQLYAKQSGGPLVFACILPDGTPSKQSCSAGTQSRGGLGTTRQANVANAVSADGRRIFWTNASDEGRIYVRENPFQPESAGLHGQAVGTGDLTGPAAGVGNLVQTSTKVKKAKATSGAFLVGEEITAPGGGIPAETTIVAVEETAPGVFTLTLSAAATATESGAELTTSGLKLITGAKATSGAFAAGQEITSPGGGIPEETTIAGVKETAPGVFSLTLTKAATVGEAGASLRSFSECAEAEKACTVPVSAAAEKERGTTASHYWAAAEDGSRAVFSTGNYLNGKAALYEFEPGTKTTKPIAGKSYGVVGASKDARRVYFVSAEVLTGEEENSNGDKAVAAKLNLYFHEAGAGAGSYRFIGTLASGDLTQGPHSTWSSLVGQEPISHNGRASADGLHAAFMSQAPLTGYDNADAQSGEADAEAFVYDAETGDLRCASCNPSGARPVGRNVAHGKLTFWAAARLPAFESTLYAPRVLSEEGTRLYFESFDSLAPRDTNGKGDVYQWEATGTGSCEEGGATYSEAAGGCIDLISSGQGNKDSQFVDASPDGHDVFFTTLSSLVPQDYGLADIYDARIGGGFAAEAQPPAQCEGEACQSAPEAPNDPTPASATFEGAGNVVEEPPATPTTARCAKGKVKRHGKCVAKRHKKAAKRAKRRANHNRRAGR